VTAAFPSGFEPLLQGNALVGRLFGRGEQRMTEMMKTLWASVQGDPVFMRRVNGWLTIFWIAMIPISLFTGWINSVSYVAALSLWALVSGHWSAWQAARVEVKQDDDAAVGGDSAS